MSLTEATLRRFAPGARQEYVNVLLRLAPEFPAHDIGTPIRLSHWISQNAAECGGFRHIEENLHYTTAARILAVFGVGKHSAGVTPREAAALVGQPERLAERVYGLGNPKKARDLGNTSPGDGWLYRARGPGQITGRKNYARLGYADNPDALLDPEIGLRASMEFWRDSGCGKIADTGNIVAVTKRYNGGSQGLDDRRRWLKKALPIFGPGAAPAARPPARAESARTGVISAGDKGPQVEALQRALAGLGYQVGSQDGDFGAATARAVVAFQFENGLPTDGEWGVEDWDALKSAAPVDLGARSSLTVEDLRERGSSTVAITDNSKKLAAAGATASAAVAAEKTGALDVLRETSATVTETREVVTPLVDGVLWAVATFGPVLALIIFVALYRNQIALQAERLLKAVTGIDLSK